MDHLTAWLLLVACADGRGAPPEAVAPEVAHEPGAPQPTAVPAEEAPLPSEPFSCDTAAAWMGHPDAAVESCRKTEHLDVYSFLLRTPALPDGGALFHVAVREGRPVDDRGDAAVARFLRESGALEARELDLAEVGQLLNALAGWPRGFDFESVGFELEGVGRSSLKLRPFRLVLYRPVVPGGGGHGPPRYERATLWEEEGVLTWLLERREPARGPFVEARRWAIE